MGSRADRQLRADIPEPANADIGRQSSAITQQSWPVVNLNQHRASRNKYFNKSKG